MSSLVKPRGVLQVGRRSFLAATGWLAATAAFLPRSARADEVSAKLAEIARARASLKTLVAPFTQERTIGLLATVVKSDGEMTLVRPDKLRWELKPPDAITYWLSPEGFAYATPKGSAAVGKGGAGRFGAVLADMLVLLGGDLEKLRSRYHLSVATPEGGGVALTAVPRAEDVKKHVKRLEMAAGPDLVEVRRIVIEEASGDRSVIAFGQGRRDVPVDPERMRPPRSS